MRPAAVCYCAFIDRVDTRTRVLILQHPRERKVGINTARIAHLCLPNSELCHGVDFSRDPVVQRALADPHRTPIMLFPGPEAIDLRSHPPAGPVTLIVPDGTWWQATKLVRSNPQLAALPRYGLTLTQPSRYRIRREPAEHCASTIEALVEVLAIIEGDRARVRRMLVPFEAMVERQLEWSRRNAGKPSRHATHHEKNPLPVSRWLRGRPEAIVLAAGECNDWPRAARAGLPDLVHWVAVRPATGERFQAVVRTHRLLAPSCHRQLELPRELLENGERLDSVAKRWREFLNAGDLVCTWGTHAADVAAREGLAFELRLDLRAFSIKHLGRRMGQMDAYAKELGATLGPPSVPGRAGKKLAMLGGIAEALTARFRAAAESTRSPAVGG